MIRKITPTFGKDLRYLSRRPSSGRSRVFGHPSHWVATLFIAVAVGIWLGSAPDAAVERSSITLNNTGRRPIPIRWFPHPFYPQTEGDELCRLNIPVSFPENDGYALADSGFIARKNWPHWDKGYYQALAHEAHSNLVVLQKHPAVGLVAATCSYVPNFFPIWGNKNTFSWEPFLERSAASGQQVAWSIDYEF